MRASSRSGDLRTNPVVLAFTERLKQHSVGEGTQIVVKEEAKAGVLRDLFALSQQLGFVEGLPLAEIDNALQRSNLPIWHSLFGLLRPVSDPATLHFPGNYDYNLLADEAFFEMMQEEGAGVDLPLHVLLLSAGLLKFMGDYGAADGAFRSIGGLHGLIGQGDLRASVALFARHLARDEKQGVTQTGSYGAVALLRRALCWDRMPEPGFAAAEALYQQAVRLSPNVALGHYVLGLLYKLDGRLSEAVTSLERAHECVRHGGMAARTLGLQIERLRADRGQDLGDEQVRLMQRPPLSADKGNGRSTPARAIDSAGYAGASTGRRHFRTTRGRQVEALGIGHGYVGAVPAEDFTYSYMAHDAVRSRRVEVRRTSRQMYAFRARNVWPLGPAAVPVALDGHVLDDTLMFTGYERELWDPCLFSSTEGEAVYELPEPFRVKQPVILLPGLGSFYYHFLFDAIGALALVPRADWEGRTPVFAQAPEPGPLLPWQNEILSMISMPRPLIYEGRGHHAYDDAIVCSYPGQDNAVPPTVIRFLRDQLYIPGGAPRSANRVFFTRTRARAMGREHSRQANALAERYGFRCVDPLRLSVREQRKVLANCGVFMCEAGSGLSNLLFLPEGATAIILGTKLTFKDYFGTIAGVLKLDLHVVLSDVERMFPRHQFIWTSFVPGLDLEALQRCFLTCDAINSS